MTKTVFVTIFEGIESKNILRTAILPTLLSDSGIELILLTKSRERALFHQKEFADERIHYEVIGWNDVRGLDSFFARLKFLLLRTETMDLRRRMRLAETRNILAYAAGTLANRALARPSGRRLARFFDYILVRRNVYGALFEKYRPSLIVAANPFDEREAHLIREAKRRGVKTVAFINSWDRVTARSILRLLADHFIVFNDQVKQELAECDDVRREDIYVGGIPQYDQYFSLKPKSREEFFKDLGLDPSSKLIVFSPIGATFSESDWSIIDLLERLRKEGHFGENVSLHVRFSPNEFPEKEELARRPWLSYTHPGIRFSEHRGIDWDMDFEELRHLTDTLHHMSVMICYASSISVDAAVLDKPVINLNFEIKPQQLLSSPTKFYQMTHYKKALDSGGIRLVNSKKELVESVRRYLNDPSLDAEGRKKLAGEQCQFLDGKSGERIGKFILSQ